MSAAGTDDADVTDCYSNVQVTLMRNTVSSGTHAATVARLVQNIAHCWV